MSLMVVVTFHGGREQPPPPSRLAPKFLSSDDTPMFRPITRREAIATAAALGVSLAWASRTTRGSRTSWQQRGECYPQGVASGDPSADGMILWTRRPPVDESSASRLAVEISNDTEFRRVVSKTHGRYPRTPTGRVECSSPAFCPVASTGIASPTSMASAAALAGRSRRRRRLTLVRCVSHSSAARTCSSARATRIAV